MVGCYKCIWYGGELRRQPGSTDVSSRARCSLEGEIDLMSIHPPHRYGYLGALKFSFMNDIRQDEIKRWGILWMYALVQVSMHPYASAISMMCDLHHLVNQNDIIMTGRTLRSSFDVHSRAESLG